MNYEIEVQGPLRENLTSLLADMVGPSEVVELERSVRLHVIDQAALVSVVARVHDLGLAIERISRPSDR